MRGEFEAEVPPGEVRAGQGELGTLGVDRFTPYSASPGTALSLAAEIPETAIAQPMTPPMTAPRVRVRRVLPGTLATEVGSDSAAASDRCPPAPPRP